MKLFPLRAPKALLASTLALVAGTFATAGTAEAQRDFRIDRSGVTASDCGPAGCTTVQVGPRGASFSTQRGRHRIPRGYDGGRYETRYQKVWVPGRCERVWHPARYEWRYEPCGRRVRVLVQAGHWDTIQHPGYYEQRAVKVWVPARRIHVGGQRGYDRGRSHRVSHVGGRRIR